MENEDLLEKLKEDLSDFLIDRDNYIKGEELGHGGYGVVYLCIDKQTNEQVAIKELHLETLKGKQLKSFCREIRVLAVASHPFLVRFIGFTTEPPYWIVTEYASSGSLFHKLHKKNNAANVEQLTGSSKTQIAMGIAGGMARLHELNVIHRDLKTLNVLLDSKFLPKICDYGIARFLGDNETGLVTKKVGTPAWMAPELFQESVYTNKVDVYSYGIMLWEMLSGNVPYKGKKPAEVMQSVVMRDERPPLSPLAPNKLKNLIIMCWNKDAKMRPTFAKIYELFASKTIKFPDTDDTAIQAIISITNKWKFKNMQQEELLKSQALGSNKFMSVPKSNVCQQVFEMQDMKEVYQFMVTINEKNCSDFYKSVKQMVLKYIVGKKCSNDIILNSALFEVLRLILNDKNCMKVFIKEGHYKGLPFEVESLQDITFSIMIAIVEQAPKILDSAFITMLEDQNIISKQGMKISRIISTCVDSYNDDSLNWDLTNVLLMNYDLFITLGCAKPLINTAYKLFLIPSFKEARGQYCLSIFTACLTNKDEEIVELAYQALINIQAPIIPLDSSVIANHIKSITMKNKALTLLCYSKPIEVTTNLLETLLEENFSSSSKLASYAFLSICQYEDVSPSIINVQHKWLVSNPESNIVFAIQILLVLIQFESNQRDLINLIGMPKFLTDALSILDISVFLAIRIIINKLAINAGFVSKLQQNNFIKFLIKYSMDADDEDCYWAVLEIFDRFSAFPFCPDWTEFIPKCLYFLKVQFYSKLNYQALNFIFSCSKTIKGAKRLKEEECLIYIETYSLKNPQSLDIVRQIKKNIGVK